MNSESLVFHHPPDSFIEFSPHGIIARVPDSFGIALDEALVRVWQWADGRTQAELEALPLFAREASLAAELMALRVAGLLLPPLDRATTAPNLPWTDRLPLVSVIIVTRNGWHHLQECLPSLLAQTYPHLEVIVVDDQSTDGTAEQVRVNFPMVRVVKQVGGPNFAAGCNRGIEQATGDLIFLLNNDTVLDSQCVAELVTAHGGRAEVAGVAAMLRFYGNRPFVNGLGTYIPPRGLGHDVAIGSLDVGQFDGIEQVPLVCFGAALLTRATLNQIGFIDEAYQFYYEDADWSYRARALGWQLRAAPRAKVYHKFSASTSALPSAFKVRLVTRNRLRFALKNLPSGEAVRQLMWHTLEDAAHSARTLSRWQGSLAWARVRAWFEFIASIPSILLARRRLWYGRMRHEVSLPALAAPFPPLEMHGVYPRLTQGLVEQRYQSYLARSSGETKPPRVLIISPDTINVNMGGVGMRYWELARTLSAVAPVTLAAPAASELKPTEFTLRTYTQGREDTLRSLVAMSDIVLLSGFIIYHHPFLRDVPQAIVVDLYDPTVLENLERFATRPMNEQQSLHPIGITTYNDLLRLGDYFICASEQQHDYWLGALTTMNRINPATYAADPTLRRLIEVVPFGLPNDPPQHTQHVLKGVWPGIGESDQVIVWGGGLWDWLDPLTAIEAMPSVLKCVPHARLFFMGTKHPNPDVPPSRMAQRAVERAAELGLKDRAIFFNDWTPYTQRENYLSEADVAVSLHGDHIETRFAVRTRLMDYLWASVPMVVTGGDTLSELVAKHDLGRVVSAGDVAAVAQALIELLQSPPDRAHFAPIIETFRWARVVAPLARYVAAPWRNGERIQVNGAAATSMPPPATPLWQLPAKAIASLWQRGVRGLMNDVRAYAIWRLRH